MPLAVKGLALVLLYGLPTLTTGRTLGRPGTGPGLEPPLRTRPPGRFRSAYVIWSSD